MNKAQKFRTLADESKSEYHQMLRFLKKEAKKGNYSIYVYTIHQLTKQKLEVEGYKIAYNQGDFRERSYYTISWN
jgi:hypothetical protein